MTLSCSDICEIVHERLIYLGFKISEDEDHTDMISALNECALIKEKDLLKLKKRSECLNFVSFWVGESLSTDGIGIGTKIDNFLREEENMSAPS